MRVSFIPLLALFATTQICATPPPWSEELLIQKQLTNLQLQKRDVISLRKELELRKGSTVKSLIITASSRRGRGYLEIVIDGEPHWSTSEVATTLRPFYIPLDYRLNTGSTIRLRTSGRLHIASIGAVVVDPFRYTATCYYDNDKDFSFQENRALGRVTGESIDEILSDCWDKSRKINRHGEQTISVRHLTSVSRPRGLGSAICWIKKGGSSDRANNVGRVFGKDRTELESSCREVASRAWGQYARYQIEHVERPRIDHEERGDRAIDRDHGDRRDRSWEPRPRVGPPW